MKTISTTDYNILIGDVLSEVSAFISERNYNGICIIVDENTKRDCLALLQAELGDEIPVIQIQSGEIN
ncbi:MAG: 3-dehydroquinate synthase, partial [Saprospiraceae bacterium]